MSYQHVQTSRNLRKHDIVNVMGGECQICGYKRSIHALELHRIDPTTKEFTFDKATSHSWDAVGEELKKCALLCANCHREIHDGTVNLKLTTPFNNQAFLDVKERIDALKTKKIKYCKVCGRVVSQKSSLCVDCANNEKRNQILLKRERPNRDELKQLIRTKSFLQIAKMFGVSDNAIRKWCIKQQLPSKQKEIRQYNDEQWSQI